MKKLILIVALGLSACGTQQKKPDPFESNGELFVMPPCEDMRKENPKANC